MFISGLSVDFFQLILAKNGKCLRRFQNMEHDSIHLKSSKCLQHNCKLESK